MQMRFFAKAAKGATIAGALMLISATVGSADETDARQLLRAMTGYVTSLDAFGFDFDEYHEIVTTDGERLGLASSGSVSVGRPDKIRLSHEMGFTDVDIAFDGQALTVFDSASGLFARQPLPGTLEHLIDTLRDDFGRSLPAGDLLTGNGHGALSGSLSEIKDLGTSVVSGTLCDHLAVRGEEVDWQIWIAQGDAQFPCMFIITSRNAPRAPQYRVQIRNWHVGANGVRFSLEKPAAATEVEIAEYLAGAHKWPENFNLEGVK